MAKEVYVFTKEDMVMVKEKAREILKQLPDDPKTGLLVLAFLTHHFEAATGLKIENIEVGQEQTQGSGE